MLREFRDFIAKGNVLDLAVAVIIGAAFATITTSLTNDIIMPVVGAIFGGLDFANHFVLLGEIPDTFKGDPTVAALRPVDPDAVKSIARRFAAPVKRKPMALPAIRLLVGDLVEGRTFAVDRTSAASFAAAPAR